MPTPQTQAEAAARVAALARALPDTALCAFVDAMQWAVAEGHLPDLVSSEDDATSVAGFLRAAEAATDADYLAHGK